MRDAATVFDRRLLVDVGVSFSLPDRFSELLNRCAAGVFNGASDVSLFVVRDVVLGVGRFDVVSRFGDRIALDCGTGLVVLGFGSGGVLSGISRSSSLAARKNFSSSTFLSIGT